MVKRAKKENITWEPIEGLEHSESVMYSKTEDTVTEGDRIPTSSFKYMKFNYESFNPMQSKVIPHIDSGANILVSSPTASGKTVVIEACAAYAISKGKKAIYISPQKSLSNEKLSEWEDLEHDFAQYKIGILTGDFTKTSATMANLNNCDLIILTNEMLNSVARVARPDKEEYSWLFSVGAVIIDEIHLVGDRNRGDKLEVALMLCAELCPESRIYMFSATAPNIEDLQKWVQKITNRETLMFKSNYRPCTVTRHYIKVSPTTSEKQAKVELTKHLVNHKPDEIFLTFIGAKKYGAHVMNECIESGIDTKFFKADLSIQERNELYRAFCNKEFRHMVASTAISAGINLPARNVIVSDMNHGAQQIVSTTNLIQEIGRAGRPKYDKVGDAYIFIKDGKNFKRDFERVQKGESVISQLQDADTLAFHVLAEVYNKKIKNPEDLIKWYEKTLACYQTRAMEFYEAKEVFNRLLKCGCIILDVDGENYTITQTGIIGVCFYLLPEDLLAWKKNFDIFYKVKGENSLTLHQQDLLFAQALSHIPTWEVKQKAWISQEEISMAYEFFNVPLKKGSDKIALGYYLILNSDAYQSAIAQESKVKFFHNTIEQIKMDSERIISALSLLDVRTKKWQQGDFWSMMATRLKYGVPPERLELCKVEGIGGARSKMLWDNGIRSINDLIKNQHKVKEIVGDKVADKIIPSAMTLGQESWW